MFKPGQAILFANRKGGSFFTSLGNLIHYGRLGFTHSAIICAVGESHVLIYEPDIKLGVAPRILSKSYLNRELKAGRIAIGTPIYKTPKIHEICVSKYKEKYSVMELYDILVFWFTGRHNVKSTDANWICSEYEGYCYKKANKKMDVVKELGLPEDDYLSPTDFFISKLFRWEYYGRFG